jgi:hypothetical protein
MCCLCLTQSPPASSGPQVAAQWDRVALLLFLLPHQLVGEGRPPTCREEGAEGHQVTFPPAPFTFAFHPRAGACAFSTHCLKCY